MKEIMKYNAQRAEECPGLPLKTTITVYQDFQGNYIPESPDLGCGKNYDSVHNAAADLAYRHGYSLVK